MNLFKKILWIFTDKNFDNNTTEKKILEKIDNMLSQWPIDNINNKDDFIKFIFNIYYYKSKYRPFVSYIEILFRYYLILLLLFLIWTSFWSWLLINEDSIFKYKELWILSSNIMYFSILIYLWIRIYYYLRKLLRNEIQKKFLEIIWIWFLKFFLFILLIPFTWFIWQFFASISNIIYISIIELYKTLS
jgi:hypothetical protein